VIVRRRAGLVEPLLALTFDDGPSEWTGPILELLAAHGARATFFVVGSAVAGREATLQRVRAEGHELGSHTFSHLHPSALDDAQLREEIRRGAGAAGPEARLVRPPYGEDAERFDRLAAEVGLGPTVLWSVDPRDWEATDGEVIAERVVAEATHGAIVDLHDGRRPQPATVAAVERMLPALGERGFTLVTVSELLAAEPRPA
jgi:peptidoglycan-N-acetylglucosamine deacetylase